MDAVEITKLVRWPIAVMLLGIGALSAVPAVLTEATPDVHTIEVSATATDTELWQAYAKALEHIYIVDEGHCPMMESAVTNLRERLGR